MIDTKSFRHHYPFTSNWLDFDGLRYHYLDEGPRNAPVVVMLHGNPTWSFYYRTLIPAISRGHRVIVPDHMGCGLSDKPQDYTYTLARHIQNLEHLVGHLNLSHITLVLHDWGGPIGMGYAVRHPKNVVRFVVFNTAVSAAGIPALPKRIKLCRIPVFGDVVVRGLNGFAVGALIFATSQPDRFRPSIRRGYLAPYNSWSNRIAVHRFVQDIPIEGDHPTLGTVAEIEGGLACFRQHPMLIIWGADDFCFSTHDFLPDWRRHFPQAKIHVLDNSGHYVVEDAYERIIPLMLEFLEGGDEEI